MLRRLLCTVLLLPTLLCSAASAAEKIVVATNPEWPPMEFLDDEKRIIGYDIDMMNAIAAEVGLETEFRMTAWDGIFAGIAAGNYDVRQIVVLRKGDSAANFEALKGRVIGGQIGTTGIFVAQKSGVDMTIREYDSVGLAMQDLLNGRIDAVICDSPVALYYANQKEGFTDHLSIAFRTEATESFGFVVQKNRKDLVERLNKGIEAVRAKGIEAELIRKWMGD